MRCVVALQKAMAVSESTASILVVVEMLAVSTTTESTSTSEPAVVGLVCHGVLTQWVQQKLEVLEKSISSPAVPLMVAPGTILVTLERPPRMDPFSLLDALNMRGKCWSWSVMIFLEARLLQLHDTGGYAKLSLDQARQSHPYHQRGAIVAQPSSMTCFSCRT